MSNILSELGIEETPISTQDTDDELLSMLMEDTKHRSENEETLKIIDYDYPDFAPETSANIPIDDINTAYSNDLDTETPIANIGLALSALPIETIVETVDITLTNAMIMGLSIDPNSEQCQDLETDAKDLKALQKATKQYLDSQEIKISPLVALLVTVSMVYGKKFFFAKRLQKMERKATLLENENQQLQNENMQYRAYIDELQAQKNIQESKQHQPEKELHLNGNFANNRRKKQSKRK